VENYLLFCIVLFILLECSFVFLSYYSMKWKRKLELRPLFIKYKFLKKEIDMGLVYEVTCAPPVDADVIERRLTVTVNGVAVATDVYASDVTNLGERTFVQGDNVSLSFVDVDDVGNVSDPAVVEFVAHDTIAPSVPGLDIKLVREE
jgi:hypothetical protein